MNKKIIGIILTSILLSLSACSFNKTNAKTESYLRENVSIAHIETVAVFPFEGSGGAARVREFTMTQVLASGMFDVVDKGRLDDILRQELITPETPVDATSIRRIGNRLNVQGFIFGSLEMSNQSRGGASFSEIIVTLRLLDTETGIILWQASGMASGYSLTDRLFGMAPKDSFTVTMDLLNELFATMN